MPSDPSIFEPVNVIDTCAIWNVLSSRILYATARSAGCSFCCTRFVLYECLHKPRTNPSVSDLELQKRMLDECDLGTITVYPLAISDLQDVSVLESRKRLGKGELSSIAFANKIRRAFLTDDQGARKLAAKVIGDQRVQTTPHLFGWLFFIGRLGDGDKDRIIQEHNRHQGPLAPYFEEMYLRALEFRLMSTTPRLGGTSTMSNDLAEGGCQQGGSTGDVS